MTAPQVTELSPDTPSVTPATPPPQTPARDSTTTDPTDTFTPAKPDTTPEQDQPAQPRTYAQWEMWLAAIGVVLGSGVAGLGLYSSFDALQHKAARSAAEGGWGWGGDAWMLPVGVDVSILAFGIVNLLLIRAHRPLAWVKWVPRAGTAVTVYLNWQTGATLPSQLGHAALASLWVVFSEIAAHLYAAHLGLLEDKKGKKVPWDRWILAPLSTPRVSRRMRLWAMAYDAALEQDKQLRIYRERLRQEHGRKYRKKADADALLPFKLARFGFTVEEALGVPLMEDVREQQREGQAAIQKAEAAIQMVRADFQVREAKLQVDIDTIQADGRLALARTEAEMSVDAEIQRQKADIQRQQAEIQAETRRVQDDADAYSHRLEAETAARQDEAQRAREAADLQAQADKEELLARTERARRARLQEETDAEAEARVKAEEQARDLQAQEAIRQANVAAAKAKADAEVKKEQLELESEKRRLLAREQSEARQLTEAQAIERGRLELESQARADAEAAQQRAEQARADAEAEESNRKAALAKKEAAESREAAAEAERRKTEKAAAAEKNLAEAAEARRRAAAAAKATAEIEARSAELQAAAVENAAKARMTQIDWDVQRVAAMIQAEGAENVTIPKIATALGVSTGSAHDRKKKALERLDSATEDSPQPISLAIAG
ncbi:DUF2637 domain-containing protein [Streptomyces celluloflavus]|uniref:DUF2637 domain-containing protein n=1 Tax=Streptomyces celluloflavus TaxID=58344 RepID=UPI0037BBBBAF